MNLSISNILFLSALLAIALCACNKEEIDLPEVETLGAKYVRRTTVELEGSKIRIDTSFQTDYGFCWNTTGLPTIENNTGNEEAGNVSGSDRIFFRSSLYKLIPGTTYYVRAFATNPDGTSYGREIRFTTMQAGSTITFNPDLNYGSVTDIEGNAYKTIEIGTQTWMAENLRTTLFSDATAIPLVADRDEWVQITAPAYGWYDNDEELYKDIYGAFYNWHAVGTGKLCPSGWHVPSDEEWKTMEIYLGMPPEHADSPALRGTDEGLMIREAGTSNWDPDGAHMGTNVTGFTGLPGGLRWGYNVSDDGNLWSGEGVIGFWWTSTEGLEDVWAYTRNAGSYNPMLFRDSRDLEFGFNVRCIKD
jgi:uncharacterized protein (TIGR02145 family)